MLGDSEKLLRKAVAKAAVLLWYSKFAVRGLSVRTYLRKGKEKLVVSWQYTSQAGEAKDGFLFVFSSLEDLETNFDDLCVLTLKERPASGKAGADGVAGAPMAAGGAGNGSGASPAGATKRTIAAACRAPTRSATSTPRRNNVDAACVRAGRDRRQAAGRAELDDALQLAQGDGAPVVPLRHPRRGADRAHVPPRARRQVDRAATSGVETVSVHLLQVSERDNMNNISIFNYQAESSFEENKMLRHILPTQANWLELHRLSNFDVERCWFPDALLTHVYLATAKSQPLDKRLFVRTLVLRKEAKTEAEGLAALTSLAKSELPTAFNTLEQAIGDSRRARTETNHIFFRLLAPVCISVATLETAIATLLPQHQDLIKQMQAYELELALPIWEPNATNVPPRHVRVVCRLAPSVEVRIYEEAVEGEVTMLKLINGETAGRKAAQGELAKEKPLKAYELLSIVDQKRLKCLKLATTFAYDYIQLFELAVAKVWEGAPSACGPPPAERVKAVELVLTKDQSKVEPLETPRAAGTNKVGMVAWLVTLCTPEYPSGRQIVIIANDITFANGTFGPLEDVVFERASQFARLHGIPRLYLGANSGARFGLSDSVRKCFRVQWNDPYDFSRGISYLWLDDKDVEALGSAVVTERVPVPPLPLSGAEEDEDEDERDEDEKNVKFHNKIVSIIGSEEGLGVESLQGAGKIAAETSIANRAIFTLGYSTARNIGIGSYVLRLGQRVIQHADAPIILTGFQALNKLLGTNVYESNLQLGGPEVMGNNGVSHLIVNSDMDACYEMVKWLSFVPKAVGSPLPCCPSSTRSSARWASTRPQGMPYDPRQLLDCEEGGLLDRGSFVETLGDWAKTVVTGRGRLGGMPVGVIATENRLVEKAILADPANLESKPTTAMQAGQVWFLDSAYKTAQAIQDFNTGEGLPLVILANWRGFSGGRKDMFEEVLKFGCSSSISSPSSASRSSCISRRTRRSAAARGSSSTAPPTPR